MGVLDALLEGSSGKKMQGGGAMKRCGSCNWKNPMGATKCKGCGANLKSSGDPKDGRVSEAFGGAGSPAADARKAMGNRPLTQAAKDADARRRGAGTPNHLPGKKKPGSSGSSKYDESKHKRGAAGTSQGGKFVKMGSSGSEVMSVQKRLGVARPHGKFGENTRQAVMKFQQKHGLKVDGVVGRQTATALAGKYRQARKTAPGELNAGDRKRISGLKKPAKHKPSAPTRGRGGVVV